jgi:hypothetical protein
VSKIEANRVYLVARYGETHMGRARFHTQGAWLNVENAREAARQANAQLIKHNTPLKPDGTPRFVFHVISYKIRDARHHCIFNITKED